MEYLEKSPGKDSSMAKKEEPEVKKAKGQPRKRVSQACDRCRSRKDKCDGKVRVQTNSSSNAKTA